MIITKMYAHTYTYIHAYIYLCIHIHTYMHIHTYTNICIFKKVHKMKIKNKVVFVALHIYTDGHMPASSMYINIVQIFETKICISHTALWVRSHYKYNNSLWYIPLHSQQ